MAIHIAPLREPANNQLFLPMASARSARSVMPLSSGSSPESTNRVKASQLSRVYLIALPMGFCGEHCESLEAKQQLPGEITQLLVGIGQVFLGLDALECHRL